MFCFKFVFLTLFQFNKTNGYPTNVCLSCIEHIRNWIALCSRCRQSHLTFTAMLSTPEPDTNPLKYETENFSTSGTEQAPPSSLILPRDGEKEHLDSEITIDENTRLITQKNPTTESTSTSNSSPTKIILDEFLIVPQNSTLDSPTNMSRNIAVKDSKSVNNSQNSKNEHYKLKDLKIHLTRLMMTEDMIKSVNKKHKKRVSFKVPIESYVSILPLITKSEKEITDGDKSAVAFKHGKTVPSGDSLTETESEFVEPAVTVDVATRVPDVVTGSRPDEESSTSVHHHQSLVSISIFDQNKLESLVLREGVGCFILIIVNCWGSGRKPKLYLLGPTRFKILKSLSFFVFFVFFFLYILYHTVSER